MGNLTAISTRFYVEVAENSRFFKSLWLGAVNTLPGAGIAAFCLCSAVVLASPVPLPVVAAKAYILKDFYSGQTLASLEAEKRLEPASLTKLMTAYLAFVALKEGRLRLDQRIFISHQAWKSEGSRMFIDPKTPVSVQELLQGMIVQSGNDASVALAEAVAGSEEVFAQMMNQQALRLGMKNSHFQNATGLPGPEHYTTASDLAVLASAIIRQFPEYFPLYSNKSFTYNKIRQFNRNLLLWRDAFVDGMKTGHTEGAGYCLISTIRRDGRRLISVVLGAASERGRATESLKLLNYGLQFFETAHLFPKQKPVQQAQLWKGKSATVPLGFTQDVYITIPTGSFKRLKAELSTRSPLIAPVNSGTVLGKMSVFLDGSVVAAYPVVALKSVEPGSWFKRLWDNIRLGW